MGKMCLTSLAGFLPCLFCGFILVVSFFLCEFLGNYFTSVCNLWKPERKTRRGHVMEFLPDGAGTDNAEPSPSNPDPQNRAGSSTSTSTDSGHSCRHASTSNFRHSTAPNADQLDAPPSYETCFPLHRSLHEMTEEVQPICCRLCKRRK